MIDCGGSVEERSYSLHELHIVFYSVWVILATLIVIIAYIITKKADDGIVVKSLCLSLYAAIITTVYYKRKIFRKRVRSINSRRFNE